ncbi:MAG: hypothetical protein GY796_00715 [Chloroflexi bacterium]|nr:hypothetical protein [Chloroflexota bacterium]
MMNSESNAYPTLPTEPADPGQTALAKWFAEQRVQSVDNLETAARQIATLCTTLLGLLLGLMALSNETLPKYMHWSGGQWLGGLGVTALFAALTCALWVVMPRATPATLNDPDSLEVAFTVMLARKNAWLRRAILLFAAGMFCLSLLVVISLAFVL